MDTTSLVANLEFGGDPFPPPVVERLSGASLDARAQPAEVEEQRLLGRGGARADDGPVAQDIVLHRRTDPPGGVGREADLPLRLETGRRLHQAYRTLLHQVRHGQAVIAVFRGRGRNQARIGVDQFVQGRLVLEVAPAQRQLLLPLASEQGACSSHGGRSSTPPCCSPTGPGSSSPSFPRRNPVAGRAHCLSRGGQHRAVIQPVFRVRPRKTEGGLPIPEQTAFRCDMLSLSGQAACKTISTLLTALSSSIFSTTASSRLSRSRAAW